MIFGRGEPNQPRPTTANVIPAVGRTGSPDPSSAEPDDALVPVEVVPSAGAPDCAATAAAPRTVRRGWLTARRCEAAASGSG